MWNDVNQTRHHAQKEDTYMITQSKTAVHGQRGSLRCFKGTLVSLRLSANDNTDGISIVEHKMPHGEAPPLHIHKNEDEVFHILRGTMRFEIGDATHIGQAGDILVAPHGVPHRFIVESREGAHCLTIMKGGDFESFIMELSTPVIVDFVPALLVPTPDMLEALIASASRNGIEIIGPPLAA
jgi:quercetin dioxygenase-like cupin family protein